MKKQLLLMATLACGVVAQAITAPTPEELAKMNLQIDNAVDGAFVHSNQMTMEYVNNDTKLIAINNFMSTGSIVRATVDWATGEVKFAPQTCDTDPETGEPFVLVSAEAKGKTPAEFKGTFVTGKTDGKSLTINAWNLVRVNTSLTVNKGTIYATDLTTRFTATNCEMKYGIMNYDDDYVNLVKGEDVSTPVYAELDGQEITVYNWGAQPSMVKITRPATQWLVDENQIVFKKKKNNFGIYPMHTAGDRAGTPKEGSLIADNAEGRTLHFGEWVMYDKAKSLDRGMHYYAQLTFPFDLPEATAVDAVSTPKAVKSVHYINAMGMTSAQPFEGLNIVVTTHINGTTAVSKEMH